MRPDVPTVKWEVYCDVPRVRDLITEGHEPPLDGNTEPTYKISHVFSGISLFVSHFVIRNFATFGLSYERPYLVLAPNLILFSFTQWENPDKVKEKHLHL